MMFSVSFYQEIIIMNLFNNNFVKRLRNLNKFLLQYVYESETNNECEP